MRYWRDYLWWHGPVIASVAVAAVGLACAAGLLWATKDSVVGGFLYEWIK